ncbi:MAG: substrate-binding domain-containing protein [Chthoniobacteraceae bacterium]
MQKHPNVKSEAESKLTSAYSALEARICSGSWPVGAILPTEYELAAEFHCGRNTVSKAIAQLVHEGFVERKRRAGTRVIRSSSNRKVSSMDLDAFAFIYPSEKHEGVRRIIAGFQDEAYEAGQRSLLVPIGLDFRKKAEMLGGLSESDVRGAVVYPVLLTPEDLIYYMQTILACPFPVVLAGVSMIGAQRPTVVADGFHAGYTMTRYLLAQGIRRIGYFGNYAWVCSGRDRYLGYRQAMDEAGLTDRNQDICLEPSQHPNFEHPLDEPVQLAKRFLEKRPEIEGVVCASDFLAAGCLVAARDMGLCIPSQLKVVGIDGFQSLPSDLQKLTSYRIPFEEIGREAFATLVAAENGKIEGTYEKLIRGDVVCGDSA